MYTHGYDLYIHWNVFYTCWCDVYTCRLDTYTHRPQHNLYQIPMGMFSISEVVMCSCNIPAGTICIPMCMICYQIPVCMICNQIHMGTCWNVSRYPYEPAVMHFLLVRRNFFHVNTNFSLQPWSLP